MALTAQLFLQENEASPAQRPSGRQAERRPVTAGATLRDESARPVDAEVVDLSTTGCLIVVEGELTVPSDVSIGIAGIGRVSGRIVRRSGQRYGCAFDEPLSDSAVQAARAVETVVAFATPAVSFPPAASQSPQQAEARRLPLRTRMLVIVGATLALWGVVIGGVAVAAAALG